MITEQLDELLDLEKAYAEYGEVIDRIAICKAANIHYDGRKVPKVHSSKAEIKVIKDLVVQLQVFIQNSSTRNF